MIQLEKINQLKRQGNSEQQIIEILQEQGHNPREINDALNQMKIKEAVNPGQNIDAGMSPSIMEKEEDLENQVPTPTQNQQEPSQNYQSQNYSQGNNQNNQGVYTPQPTYQEQNSPNQNYSDPYSSQSDYYEDGQDYSPQEQNYETQDYSPQEQNYEEYEGYAQPYESTDTIIEIAEQVFSEKTKLLESQVKELLDFKRVYQERINDMNERIKRIEKYFDKMQLAIMEKVTAFGKNIDNLQNEINMVEDSFSKMVNPLSDKNNHSHKKSTHK